MSNVALLPEEGIRVAQGRTSVVSLPAWLAVTPADAIAAHRWVRIRYSSGLFDPLTRPIIRFDTRSGRRHFNFMTGAVLGSAAWTGRVPKDTTGISISPAACLGPFSFRIDDIAPVSRAALLARSVLRAPRLAALSVSRRLTNARQSAWDILTFANAATPLAHYHAWHARFARPVEPDFDLPHCDWALSPDFVLAAPLRGHAPEDIRVTVTSLQSQLLQRWRLFGIIDRGHDSPGAATFAEMAAADARLQTLAPGSMPQVADDAWVAAISFGDTLRDYALASFAEALARAPDATTIYSDEDFAADAPLLKPDWSPLLHDASPYLGRLTFMRFDAMSDARRRALLAGQHEPDAPAASWRNDTPPPVAHLRRILYRRKNRRAGRVAATPPRHALDIVDRPQWPAVGLVLPTKDRPDLLATCIDGLKAKTDYPCFKVVVVDHETTDVRALALLSSLAADRRFAVLRSTGPFNFSKLCNAGAAAVDGDYLVFLNNDLVMHDPGWLKAMISVCLRPDAGMVGARLLFPDGRLQHGGVLLGIGGLAGHAAFKARPGDPGYLGALTTVREVSAVTAACAAVARTRFEAVGGFDADNLPIELNDIDLCLRLAERGWQNYWTPHAVLTHLESASRGVAERPSDIYARERSYFIAKWAHVIRDDPYFHPALSLFSHRPALG